MSTPSWSPDVMIERIGGDEELARQLVTLFLGDCDRMLSVLRAGVAERNPEAVRRAAHAIKGSVANFVQGGPAATALAIETCGRDGGLDGVPVLLAQLETEIAALVAGMREFERGGS